jgi:hypothetical protein
MQLSVDILIKTDIFIIMKILKNSYLNLICVPNGIKNAISVSWALLNDKAQNTLLSSFATFFYFFFFFGFRGCIT